MGYIKDQAQRVEATADQLERHIEQFAIDFRLSIPAVDIEEEAHDVLYCARKITPAQQRLLDGLEIVRQQVQHIGWAELSRMRTVVAADKRIS